MRLSDLKQKEIINTLDGRRLGNAVDLEFEAVSGSVQALIVPGPFQLSNLFKGGAEGYVIPWKKICKIGDDVILVELDAAFFRAYQLEE